MGCCTSIPPETPKINEHVSSESKVSTKPSLSGGPKKYSYRSSYDQKSEKSKSKTNSMSKSLSKSISRSFSPADSPECMDDCPATHMPLKSEFQLKIEIKRSEMLLHKQRIKELQHIAFNQQIASQQSKNFQRLYDVWEEFADVEDGSKMDIHGLTKALAVFGMIIDVNRDFQTHIFRKFDLDGEHSITYNDFSATLASLVGSKADGDSLQTLFELFDIDQDGYLDLEDIARILLAQNQLAVVVMGRSEATQIVYTKKQCLKQARRMLAEYDDSELKNNKISFYQYKQMMLSRTEQDMLIDHMPAPSLSANTEHNYILDPRDRY